MDKETYEKYGLYGERVADSLREMYEKETGDKLDMKDDYTKVLEYCDIKVILENIPVENAIIKLNDKYAVIFNEEVATNLRKNAIGIWNVKLIANLGRIIFNNESWNQQETGTVLYPQEYYNANDQEKLKSKVKSIIDKYSNTKTLVKKPKKNK